MSRAWFIATRLDAPLAEDARTTVDTLRSAADRSDKSARAFAFVYAAVEYSLAIHFRQPLASLGVGTLTRKSLDLALDLALRGLKGPMRRIFDGMDETQLSGVADAIEERLYPDPHG